MSIAPLKEDWVVVDVDGTLPGHLELPQDNGEIVENWLQLPQSILLTDILSPRMDRIRPDGRYMIGGDLGIYWRLTEPLERGVVVPDWMYVAGVPRASDGEIRRSYVLWKEKVAPEIVMEFSLDDGSFERDRTPLEGKFWIYEHAVQARYYVIYVIPTAEMAVYRLENGVYRELEPNSRGRYPIDSLGLELGVWRGRFLNEDAPWMRWYNSQGKLLLLGNEQAKAERRRTGAERERAETERRRAEAERQRAEAADRAFKAERQRAEAADRAFEAERQRAEAERERAEAADRALEAERGRAEMLAAKLKELGIDLANP